MRVEERAVSPAPTNVGASEQPVISAVFANSVGAFLGVDQPTVAAGDAVFPVITSRASVKGPYTDSTEAAESTGAWDAELLKPERLQASYFVMARFRGMSEALRENLSMALGDKLDEEIVNGDDVLEGTNLANHNVSAASAFPDPVRLRPSGRAVCRKYLRSSLGDGQRVLQPGRVRLPRKQQRHYCGQRVGATVTKQNNIVRLGRRDMVSPIWEGVTLIPDEVTQAKKGEIVITAKRFSELQDSFSIVKVVEFRVAELRSTGRVVEGRAILMATSPEPPLGRSDLSPVGDLLKADVIRSPTGLARTGGGGLVLTDGPDALDVRADTGNARSR